MIEVDDKRFQGTLSTYYPDQPVTETEAAKPMDEQQFLIDLIFKDDATGHKLCPAEVRLLLAHISEILKEVEEEENQIINKAATVKAAKQEEESGQE